MFNEEFLEILYRTFTEKLGFRESDARRYVEAIDKENDKMVKEELNKIGKQQWLIKDVNYAEN